MCHAKVRHAKVFYPKVPLTPKCPFMLICQSGIHANVALCQSCTHAKVVIRQNVRVKVFHAKVFYAKMSVSRNTKATEITLIHVQNI